VTGSARRRIELWVEARGGRPAVNPVMTALLSELRAGGATVAVRVPEAEIAEPAAGPPTADLVLLKTATTLGLSRARADEAAGVRFLNDARATLRAHDKAAALAALAVAGVPVPETFLVASGAGAGTSGPRTGEWVTKPVRGVHGRGVAVHATAEEALANLAARPIATGGWVVDDGTRLLQRRVGGGAPDVKAYVAGDAVFAGRKRFGPESYAHDRVEPVGLDATSHAIVLAAGRALGLRLYGVDLRLEGGLPFVVDVNPFPGYRGFPEAVPALLAEMERAA
jgi:ribosomal protein S6--L-glutamate ligase